jgi:peptide/nickel transport system substrate-binding protein
MLTSNVIRRGLLVGAAAGVTVGLAACGGGGDSSTTSGAPTTGGSATTASTAAAATGAAKAGNLVFADAAVANALDPDGAAATTPANLTVLNNAYEGIINYKFKPNATDLGGGQMLDADGVAPGLAESWKQTDKGVTFTLRKGAMDQYGNEFTSADVKYTYDRNTALKATGAFILTANGKITGVKTNGKYSFTYVTSSPAPMLLPALASAYVKPIDATEAKKHATAKDPWSTKWLNSHTAGWGPYTVSSYSSGKEVDLAPSATYWNGKPQNAVKLIPIPDASNRLAAVQKGDVNLAIGLTPQQEKSAAGQQDLHEFRFNGNVVLNLYPNEKLVPATKNPLVRQAMHYAIPTADLIKQVYLGYAFDPKSIIPSYVKGFTNKYWPYSYDIAKAKALMKQAGYANGFSMEIFYANESATLAQVAPIVQSSFAQIGIKVKLVTQPQATILTRMFGDRDMQSYFVDLAASVVPELANTGAIWATGGFGNTTFYQNKAFDKAAAASASSLDPAVRDPANDQLQKIIAEDPPTVQMAGLQSVAVTSGNITGYSWTPEGSVPFSGLKVDAGSGS